jgi:hypothetical protein
MRFMLRAVGRRIAKHADDFAQTPEGEAAIELHLRTMQLADTSREVAGTASDDAAASAELQTRLPEDPDAIRGAVDHLGALRTSYLDDRAYRLLTAAVQGTPVRPIDPDVAEQFVQEAQLGRMSLDDAFAQLISLEPRLSDLQPRPSDQRAKERGGLTTRSGQPIVGPGAESAHAVVNTDLARGVVVEYLAVTRDGSAREPDLTPFFERKRRTYTGTFAMFGTTQPRAKN